MDNPEDIKHETVLDSDTQQVGDLYGAALLSAAGDQADAVLEEFDAIVKECLDKQPNLEVALNSPRVSQEQKEGMLDRIFSGKINPVLLNFLKVLCRRDRIQYVRAIHSTAGKLRNVQLGRETILVTSAQPLSEQQLQEISSKMKLVLGKDVVLDAAVDSTLLGGVVIRVGDQVFDGSVVGKLSAIRSSLKDGIQKAIRDKYESLMSS